MSRHKSRVSRSAQGSVKSEQPQPESLAPVIYTDLTLRLVQRRSLALWPSVLSTMRRKILARAPAELKEPGSTWVGEEAALMLNSLLVVLEDFAEQLSRPIDSFGWLWYARRLDSSIFEGDLATTGPVDWLIFEMLGARASRPWPALRDEALATYPVDDESLRRVLRLAAVAVSYSETAGTLRRAGKGAVIQAHADHLPRSVPSKIDGPIRIFDERVAAHPGLPAGTRVVSGPARSDTDLGLLTVARPYGLQETTGWSGRLSTGGITKMDGGFVLQIVTLDSLREILGQTTVGVEAQEWWEPALPSLIVFLRSLTIHFFTVSESAGLQGPKVGYLVSGSAYVQGMVQECLPVALEGLGDVFPQSALPTSGAEVLAQIASMAPSLTPLRPGPVLRSAGGNGLVIDLFAATQAFYRMLTIPSRLGGAIVNKRAAHFELTVQREVDLSDDWRPAAAHRVYVGRKLKLNGQQVTDVDALAVHEDTLLLISCKSIPYTPEYDAGEFKAVRNVRTDVERYVESWLEITDRLRQHPVGDNYDFSSFTRVEAVVCTPHVFYVESDAALEAVPLSRGGTVRRACSIDELSAALSGPQAQKD